MKYFLSNRFEDIKEVDCKDDQEAFEIAQQLNGGRKDVCEKYGVDRSKNQNWNAYNGRGDLIYRVAVMR